MVPSRGGEKLETRCRFRERYGRRGGDGGDRARRAPGRGANGSAVPGREWPTARIRAGPPGEPGSAGSRPGGALLAPAARSLPGTRTGPPRRSGPPLAVRPGPGQWLRGSAHRPGRGQVSCPWPHVLCGRIALWPQSSCVHTPEGICQPRALSWC